MKAKVLKREKTWLFTVLLGTAVLAFLAGYGFQKFINQQEKLKEVRMRRDLGDVIEKRNFESRDRTPGDVMHDEIHYHAIGMNNVNATYIQQMHK